MVISVVKDEKRMENVRRYAMAAALYELYRRGALRYDRYLTALRRVLGKR
ncbi:MAG TPA: hypothetical protein GXZ77_01660 [Papillibacter sp.]|jgi:hypothetical protein|nr:hypothetical protein [Papillibacter sp.]